MLPLLVPAVASLVSTFAPDLIRFVTGDKAGTDTASKVLTKVVDTALQLTEAPTIEEAEQVIRANPELQLKFKADMARVEVETYKLDLEDRQNARARDVAITASGGVNYRAWFLIILAAVFLLLSATGAVVLAVSGKTTEGIFLAVFGLLSGITGWSMAKLSDCFSFEFGSTKQTKDQAAAATAATVAAVPALAAPATRQITWQPG